MPIYRVEPIAMRTTRPGLREYLETEILPRYSVLDCGHNQNHIYQVLKTAYELDDKLGGILDNDLLTTAVCYHDLGVTAPTKAGRAVHHETSAQIVRADARLR